MTELEASAIVMSKLCSDQSILNLVDSFQDSLGASHPMIIVGDVLPSEWDVKSKTLNMYSLYTETRLEYKRYRFMLACRSNDYASSRQLAFAVIGALNRQKIDSVFVIATINGTLTPADADVDNYNTPVEILVRSS